MRSLLTILAAALLGAVALVYAAPDIRICVVPQQYSVGEVDERFGISRERVQEIAKEAEDAWERASGRDLFAYDERASLGIHLVYDERQRKSNAEVRLREDLEDAQEEYEVQTGEYESLYATYERLAAAYERNVTAYEARLARYTKEVEEVNAKGGADQATYDRLEAERRDLRDTLRDLERERARVNAAADAANAAAKESQTLVERYNQGVGAYNERFGEGEEFTEGDFQGDRINVYQFDDEEELKLVLMHELGHALRMEHVDDENAILYYLMTDERGGDSALSESDLRELERACPSWFSQALLRLRGILGV